jgi:hypothetical protein
MMSPSYMSLYFGPIPPTLVGVKGGLPLIVGDDGGVGNPNDPMDPGVLGVLGIFDADDDEVVDAQSSSPLSRRSVDAMLNSLIPSQRACMAVSVYSAGLLLHGCLNTDQPDG